MASLQPDQQPAEAYDSEPETDNQSECEADDELIEDLAYALDNQFKFEGSFACASKMRNIPNPCLDIEGVGLVGLPLSDRDAKLIIECAAQAPYGHGMETVVNKDVRDTWEIDPQKVLFWNTEWEHFIHASAVQNVCRALGVQAGQVLPRCELYKLLLYEPGSHFLPHQDTQKADGMFATMIVVLPSAYTGGQVHVSHGTQSKVFDLSDHSIISTSILAWYTDVVHEVKPVTSGYRLALSYNLIHISTTLPKPFLPDMDGPIQHLRTVLREWKEGVYKALKDSLVAYLLNHQYSERELLGGMMSLKGVDAHKISFLAPIAAELGFFICLGNLTYHIYGDANDYGNSRKRRKRNYYSRGSDSDNASDVSMAEIHSTSMDISHVVNLNGVRLLKNDLAVSKESLIPGNPFEDAEPDEKSYSGYMGNCAGSLSHYYHRTVLVLIRWEDTLSVFCSNRADGFDYGLSRLKQCDNVCPTQMDRDMAYAMISNLGTEPNRNYSLSNSQDVIAQNIRTMVDYAFAWNESGMWSSIMQRAGAKYLDAFGADTYFEGWYKFPFREIEPGLVGTLSQITPLRKRVDFIDAIRTHAAKTNETISEEWYKQQLVKALSTYEVQSSYSDDVAMLLQIAHTWGLRFIYENVIFPLSQKQVHFDFWVCLAQSLAEKKATLCAPRADDGETTQPQSNALPKLSAESEFHAILNHCLKIIVPQWKDVPVPDRPLYTSNEDNLYPIENAKINRIIQILDVCFLSSRPELCYNLLASVLTNSTSLSFRFKTLYTPLIAKFVEFLRQRNIPLTSPPFDFFSRELISLYLHYIIGTSQWLTQEVANLQKVGCGCNDCNDLDRFITDPNLKEVTFRMIEPRRRHLEERLKTMRWWHCNWTTIRGRSPYGLQITKKDEYFARMSWAGRRTAALAFLGSFGNDALLPVLMGYRWGDALAALQGVRQFSLHVHPNPMPMMVSSVPPAPPPGMVFTAQPPMMNPQGHPPHRQAQVHAHLPGPLTLSTRIMNQSSNGTVEKEDALERKRKRPSESDEVIDLTKED